MKTANRGSDSVGFSSVLTPNAIAGFNQKLKGLDDLAHVNKSCPASFSHPDHVAPKTVTVDLMSYLDSFSFLPTK
jgi:hypothetical protein